MRIDDPLWVGFDVGREGVDEPFDFPFGDTVYKCIKLSTTLTLSVADVKEDVGVSGLRKSKPVERDARRCGGND